ncbi:hypothetical protein [Streptomyces achromogenes]|uniref:hypothetical protein n=1 Tax=Streptomyces achromogenes TaxID=67255 RepID=UPI003F4CED99
MVVTAAGLGGVRPTRRTAEQRVPSVPRALRHRLRDHPHLVALVHERGLTDRMFLPAQRILAREAHAAGLRGEPCRQHTRSSRARTATREAGDTAPSVRPFARTRVLRTDTRACAVTERAAEPGTRVPDLGDRVVSGGPYPR